MATLLAIDPQVASIAAVGFGGSYASITWLARRKLRRNSQRIADEHTQVVKALQEGLGGIRDVLLDGTQPVYCEVYQRRPTSRCGGRRAPTFSSPEPALRDGGAWHGADRRACLRL